MRTAKLRRTSRFWLLFIVAALVGCGRSATPRGPGAAPPAAGSLSERLWTDVDAAQRIGHAIYLHDKAAAVATDAVLMSRGGKRDARVTTFITLAGEGDAFRVVFIGGSADEVLVHYEVELEPGARPKLTRIDPPTPASEDVRERYRALRSASRFSFQPCPGSYNHVVLPASIVESTGWIVYLLSATDRSDVMVIGGHHRFHVSEDGTRVLDHKALSASCIRLDTPAAANAKAKDGLKAQFPFVTHVVSPRPVETHFFVSLQHRVKLMVVTEGDVWAIDGTAPVTRDPL